jgi:hypothetical protein
LVKLAQRLLHIHLSPFPKSELVEAASAGISLKLSGHPDPPGELSVVVHTGLPFLLLAVQDEIDATINCVLW